jgi:DNA polymerase sigma
MTLGTHIDKMEALTSELLPLYKQIGLYTAGLAVRKGTIDKETENEFKTLLQGGN